jgi:hypothetical protein
LVIVLAEDERHQRFIRFYLKQKNYGGREIRFEPLPSGRGCGEQWVRENYAKQVQAFRARSAKAGTALIVAIDADTRTVDDRLRQLEQSLDSDRAARRADEERIVHLVPRRNIETWILCLSGEQVVEATDYKRRPGVDDQIRPAAESFFAWSRPNAQEPPHNVPSLTAAIPEIKRID